MLPNFCGIIGCRCAKQQLRSSQNVRFSWTFWLKLEKWKVREWYLHALVIKWNELRLLANIANNFTANYTNTSKNIKNTYNYIAKCIGNCFHKNFMIIHSVLIIAINIFAKKQKTSVTNQFELQLHYRLYIDWHHSSVQF